MKVAFCALGCKVNQYESDCYAQLFRQRGYEISSFDEKCDVYVINTCSVTNIGERKSRQMIRRAKKMNPSAVIAVTGCYAQVKTADIKNMPEVDVVIGTSGRHLICDLVEAVMRGESAEHCADIMKERAYEEMECAGETERTRAYIKIEDGCNNFCSYCIIPYARGPVRSRRPENVLAEAARLAKNGFCELVLTGISISSYGRDLEENIALGDIINRVSETDGIERVRLGSIDPRIFDDDFIALLAANKKVCRQFHISLQSGSAGVLSRMNRKYTPEQYLSAVEKIRRAMPDAAITTDIICGFPGESDIEFEETKEFVKKARFARVHVFPYSEREGTAAAKMKQLDKEVREKRAKELFEITENIRAEFEESFIGSTHGVLFEQSADGVSEGLTKNYLRIYVNSEKPLDSELHSVKITGRENGRLTGTLAD